MVAAFGVMWSLCKNNPFAGIIFAPFFMMFLCHIFSRYEEVKATAFFINSLFAFAIGAVLILPWWPLFYVLFSVSMAISMYVLRDAVKVFFPNLRVRDKLNVRAKDRFWMTLTLFLSVPIILFWFNL